MKFFSRHSLPQAREGAHLWGGAGDYGHEAPSIQHRNLFTIRSYLSLDLPKSRHCHQEGLLQLPDHFLQKCSDL